jgi:hypothetical protein
VRLELRCEGKLPNYEAGELITRRIIEGPECQAKGLDLILKIAGSHSSKKNSTHHMKLKTRINKEKKILKG